MIAYLVLCRFCKWIVWLHTTGADWRSCLSSEILVSFELNLHVCVVSSVFERLVNRKHKVLVPRFVPVKGKILRSIPNETICNDDDRLGLSDIGNSSNALCDNTGVP